MTVELTGAERRMIATGLVFVATSRPPWEADSALLELRALAVKLGVEGEYDNRVEHFRAQAAGLVAKEQGLLH